MPDEQNLSAIISAHVLREAQRLMAEDRGEKYGDFRENHEHIAALWSAYLQHEITSDQCSLMMLLVKVARTRTSPEVLDHYVDGAAYIAGAARIAVERSLDS